MKRFLFRLLAGVLATATSVASAASDEPKKMYPGDPQSDQELSLVSVGWIGGSWSETTADQIIAYVAGIDGEMCPVNVGNGGGVPYCGLFLQMLPGDRTLTVRLSHSASVTPTYDGRVTTRKQDYKDLSVHLERDTIYRVMPHRTSEGSVDVSLQELCKGKEQKDMKTRFVLRDSSEASGPQCP